MNITLGHDEDLIRFGDLALIFMVTMELSRSNLRIKVFLENKLVLVDGTQKEKTLKILSKTTGLI